MGYVLARWRESFWLVPASLVGAAVALSSCLLWADHWAQEWISDAVPTGLLLGVEGSRTLLGAVAGSMLAVAGTTFSITISVIATASSSYGPRLVRNFMSDRRNQLVLGLFVSTFVYCLLVLRSITSGEDGAQAFVPYLSVYLTLVIALLNVAALVFFLHHIAQSIQVDYLIGRVRDELDAVVADLFGDRIDEAAVPVELIPAGPIRTGAVVVTPDSGFVVSIDVRALVALAEKEDVVIAMRVGPGDHVIEDEVIAEVSGARDGAEVPDSKILDRVSLGGRRTPAQDVGFAVQQLVEMAVRALSPGTNDPYTARTVLHELASAMTTIGAHPVAPTGRTGTDGRLRVNLRIPTGLDLVDNVFDDIRTHGSRDPLVIQAAVDLAGRVHRTGTPQVRERLRTHVDLLLEAFEESGSPAFDHRRLRALAGRALDPGAGHGPWVSPTTF